MAQETQLSAYDEAVFFFGGRFHQDWFGTSLKPWKVKWDDTFIAAAGYQKTWLDWNDVRIGGEVGVSGRFSTDGASAELWAASSPATTASCSSIRCGSRPPGPPASRSPPARRAGRASAWTPGASSSRCSSTWGAELNFSLVDQPQWETFVRVHHRSGGYGFIADIDASNAITGGIRYKF